MSCTRCCSKMYHNKKCMKVAVRTPLLHRGCKIRDGISSGCCSDHHLRIYAHCPTDVEVAHGALLPAVKKFYDLRVAMACAVEADDDLTEILPKRCRGHFRRYLDATTFKTIKIIPVKVLALNSKRHASHPNNNSGFSVRRHQFPPLCAVDVSEHSSYVNMHQVSVGFRAYLWMVKRIFKFPAETCSDPVDAATPENCDSSPLA